MTKKILITGKNSYIGNQLADWLDKGPDKYEVIKESVRDDKWKEIDFSKFDVIVHVAGIAHIKETKDNQNLYFKINRDLSTNIAEKAKKSKVSHFIFLSSMSVYGIKDGIINRDSKLQPDSAYGKSKLEAENIIKNMETSNFFVSIIRPPMIYGDGCKGNYQLLSRFSKTIPLFPEINNKRSMIFISNLTEFIRLLIEDSEGGIFFPQNKEYINTSRLVRNIAKVNNRKIYFTKNFNVLIKKIRPFSKVFNKLFGDLYYDKEISVYKSEYCKYSFEQTIIESEIP